MSRTYYFYLPKITCVNCVLGLRDVLKTSALVQEFADDVPSKKLSITVPDSPDKSDEQIKQELRSLINSCGIECEDIGWHEKTALWPNLWKGLISSAIGFALMGLMMSGVGIPMYVMYALMSGSSALTLYLGAESYFSASKQLFKHRTLTMDTLFSLSTLTVIGVSIASFFVDALPMMMDAGLMIFGFRHIGKAIEESIKEKVLSGLEFKNRAPKRVLRVKTDNTDEEVEVETISEHDIVRIPADGIIPFDGICLEDEVTLYDTIITGATTPIKVKKGTPLIAGMKLADLNNNTLTLQVSKPFAKSYLARLDEMLLQTNTEKAPIENSTNKILQYFIPGVLSIACLAGVILGLVYNPALAIQTATTILVAACPCTLGFITPLSVKLGITKAKECGVQFKSGKALQAASQVDTVIFDLNGTLTTGSPIVTKVRIPQQSGLTKNEFFDLLRSIETYSNHPIAQAITKFANDNSANRPTLSVTKLDLTNNCGISADLNGDRIIIGNKKMLATNGIEIPLGLSTNAQHLVYVAKNDVVIGYICLNDPLRSDAIQTVQALQDMGKKVCICTGADEVTANNYAKQLNIPTENVFANCRGISKTDKNNKLAVIEGLQKQGHVVAMVGDGANDAIPLAKADVSMAVQSPSADFMTQQQAGAIITNSHLNGIVSAFNIAKATVKNIHQNLLISLAYNTGFMLVGGIIVGLGFALNPGLGVALMVIQTSLVLLNQYRLRRMQFDLPDTRECQPTPDCTPTSYEYFRQSGLDFSPSANLTPPTPKNIATRSNSKTTNVYEPQKVKDQVKLSLSPSR